MIAPKEPCLRPRSAAAGGAGDKTGDGNTGSTTVTKKTAGIPAAREIGNAGGKPAGAIPATATLRLAAGMAACGLAALPFGQRDSPRSGDISPLFP